MTGRTAVLLVVVAFTAACGPDEARSPRPFDASPGTAPLEVSSRTELPSCGFELVGSGGGWNGAARTCFWEAYSQGRPAEFITNRPTAGGAPLLVIFRSLGGGRVVVYSDERGISISRGWRRLDCPGLHLTPDPAVPGPDWIPGFPDHAGGGCQETRLAAS